MSDPSPLPWQDDLLVAQLRLIAQSAADVTGFGAAEILVADEDGVLHLAAREGSRADRAPEAGERYPLTDGDGRLIGALGFAPPGDDDRPAVQWQEEIDRLTAQVGDAIMLALDRHQAAEEARQARTVRDLVRSVMTQLAEDADLEAALGQVADRMMEHFGLAGLWIMIEDEGRDRLPEVRRGHVPDRATVPPVPEIGKRLWERQEVSLLSRDHRINLDGVPEHLVGAALAFLDEAGHDSMVSTPLSTETGSLGPMRAWRALGAPRWTDLELETFREIGQELGRLFQTALADQRDRELVADLRALNAYKSDMVATISHELKNPLTTLQTNVELLDDPAADAEDRRRALGAIGRSTQRMTRIVDDLQLLGARRDAYEAVDLVPLLRGVCEAAEDATTLRGQSLLLRAPARPVVVSGDAIDLDRMAMNLVSNAIKYSPTGTTIRVTLERAGDEAVLSVADEGIGISEEDQRRIFTAFFRSSDPHALAETGTGLGLAIVHRIAERHQGSVTVESAPGAGSTFRVRLPLGGPDGG